MKATNERFVYPFSIYEKGDFAPQLIQTYCFTCRAIVKTEQSIQKNTHFFCDDACLDVYQEKKS